MPLQTWVDKKKKVSLSDRLRTWANKDNLTTLGMWALFALIFWCVDLSQDTLCLHAGVQRAGFAGPSFLCA